MKAKNLFKLIENNINVPQFIVVDKNNNDIKKEVEEFLPGCKVAIRSSHSSEDSKEKSYAGNFLTFLNVETDRILKVNEVFECCKNVSNGFMRVIIQEMIQSDYSGVIFTSNPQGLLNEIVINVGKGLGDNVVDNKINTTTYYKNKHNNKSYYETTKDSPALSQSIIDELFNLANNIEKIYNCPMDIEFAIKDCVVYCLQARPITTIKINNNVILDNSNIVENFSGVVCPLTSDFVNIVYSLVFKSAVSKIATKKQLKELEDMFDNMVAENNSRMYYKLNNWYYLLECLPFSDKLLEIWEEMIGIKNVDHSKIKQNILNKFLLGFKFITVILKTDKQMKELDVFFKNEIEIYRSKIANCNMKELLQLYNEIKDCFGDKWGITLYNDLYAFIFMALSKKFENKIVQGIDEIESMKPILLLNTIAFEKEQMNLTKVKNLKNQYIHLYGDRCVEELKLETKTPRININLLDDIIPIKYNEHILIKSSNSSIEPKLFERHAKKGIRWREISRLNRSRMFGVIRELFINIGKEFVKYEYIDVYEDVFYLRFSEIESIINNINNVNTDFKKLIQERKSILQMHSKLPTYDRLIFADKPFNKYPLNISNNKTNILKSSLIGIPVSNGTFRGEAIVISKVDSFIDVSNKIIVTESTDPGWVFLIEKCSAIITERGSLLSHTSIITRELNKPAIVAIDNITKIITTGDLIEINGTTGEVKIISSKKV